MIDPVMVDLEREMKRLDREQLRENLKELLIESGLSDDEAEKKLGEMENGRDF